MTVPSSYPSGDEHDLLVEAYAQLHAAGTLPTPAALSERTGISQAKCEAWIEAGHTSPDDEWEGGDQRRRNIETEDKDADEEKEDFTGVFLSDLMTQPKFLLGSPASSASHLLEQTFSYESSFQKAFRSASSTSRLMKNLSTGMFPEIGMMTRLTRPPAMTVFTEARRIATAGIAPQVKDMMRSLLVWPRVFDDILRNVRRAVLPPNLHELNEEDLQNQNLVLRDAIPLYYVPRPHIARKLLQAPDTRTRRTIIGRHIPQLLDDCEAVLTRFEASTLTFERTVIQEAIDAMREERHRSAQALMANLIDTFMWATYRETGTWQKKWDRPKTSTASASTQDVSVEESLPDVLKKKPASFVLVHYPIWATRTTFNPAKDPVPQGLNRHASLHAVSKRQYSKRNAMLTIMQATSIWAYRTLYASDN